MQYKYMYINQPQRTDRWKSVLIVGLLAMVLCLTPGVARAQSAVDEPGMLANMPQWRAQQGGTALGIFPRLRQRLMRLRQAPLVLHGAVTAIDDDSLTLELEPLRAAGRFANERHAGLLAQSLEFTFAIDEDALFFDGSLNAAIPTDIAVGDAVTIVPELAWGRPVARFLFQGTPQELRPYLYMGRMIEETDGSLLLQTRGVETTIVVDENTAWVDGGEIQDRPDVLRAGLLLRVLGVEEIDGSVRAVLVTPLS